MDETALGTTIPLIGESAPPFEAVTTQGTLRFPEDYQGKWVVLFSHPADWQPGEDVIVPPAGSCGTAEDRVQGKEEGVTCLDWFMCFKRVPKDQLDLPPIWAAGQ
jgi:peroxiredoxin